MKINKLISFSLPLIVTFVCSNHFSSRAQVIQNPALQEKPHFIYYDDSVATYFNDAMKDIKRKVKTVLPSKYIPYLNRVKVILDTVGFGLQLNSDSKKHTITYNWGVFKTLTRDQLAYEISNPKEMTDNLMEIPCVTNFERPYFYKFYSDYLSKMTDNIDIAIQAELDTEKTEQLDCLQQAPDFRWIYKRRIVYTFLHEFYHQIQNYTDVLSKLNNSTTISYDEKRKIIEKYEEAADAFVFRIAPKLRLRPTNYSEIPFLFRIFKERQFDTAIDLMKRQKVYFELLEKNCPVMLSKQGYDCAALAREVKLQQNDIDNENFEVAREKTSYDLRFEAMKNENLQQLFDTGKSFLVRNTLVIKNIDSALYYFTKTSEIGSRMPSEKANVTNRRIYELSSLIAGKILELNKNDKDCLTFYNRAKNIHYYFKEDFYASLISRIDVNKRH
ncbi:hypothetical protein ACFGVS_23685 [Mucilaginibacter sp. AW1-7]|uniref:hypothetical protein n=1 Tax=Mucilaginibacter sp. AW1-7 TaxID=3349874 RepID=UPI003F732E7C